MHRHLPPLSVAIALLFCAVHPLAGQGSGSVLINKNGHTLCGFQTPGLATNINSAISCSPAPYVLYGAVRVFSGAIGDTAVASGLQTTSGSTVTSTASANWGSTLYWSNPLVSTVLFTAAVRGSASLMLAGPSTSTGASAQATLAFNAMNPFVNTSVQMTRTFGLGAATSPPTPQSSFSPSFDTTFVLAVPTKSWSSLIFSYFINGTASATGDASASIGSQMWLTNLAFLDAQGTGIPDVKYRFQTYTQISPVAPVLTPEPISSLLVGTGLLALGVLRRSRKKRPVSV